MSRSGDSLSGRGRNSVSGRRTVGRGSGDASASRQRFHSFPETREPQVQDPVPSGGPSSSYSDYVPPSPNVPPASVTINVDCPQVDKILVEVVQVGRKKKPTFIPSVSNIITKTFKQKQRKKGTVWKCLNQKKVDWYWNEFEKKVTWIGPTFVVRECWESIASVRYSGWLSNLKKAKKRPTFCKHVVWTIWRAYWEQDSVKEMILIKATNRRGKDGTTPSIHTGGSKSHLEHLRDAFKKTGIMSTLVEHFRAMHKRKDKNGNTVFCDIKSAQINEKLEARIGQLTSEMKARGEPVVIDENRVFLEVLAELGGVSKGRVYGLGNVVSALNEDATCSSTSATPTAMTPDQMTEIVGRLVDQAFSEKMSDVVQTVLQEINRGTQPPRADQSDIGNGRGDDGAESDGSGGEHNVDDFIADV